VRVVLIDDPTAFRQHDWTALVEADPDGTFFHTPAYLKLWWEEFGTGTLVIALALEGDEVVGACCFEIQGATLTFLGGSDVTDYMGPVALAGSQDAVAKELLAAMTESVPWERADLRGLAETSAWLPVLAGAAASLGLQVRAEDDGVAPFLALPPTSDSYLAGIPAKLRHEVRRKERRLREDAGDYRVVASTVPSLHEDMDRFVELHRSSPGPKGRFMRPGMEIFFRRLGDVFLPSHVFHLVFLEVDGAKVAGAIGFGYGDTFSLYNSTFDRRFAHVSPGMVLVAELIRAAIESGRSTFDMLKGDLDYKYRFGAAPRAVRTLTFDR
jgi:CelD/BcsL family acetyltransferase involved in cellulose biosynthesis